MSEFEQLVAREVDHEVAALMRSVSCGAPPRRLPSVRECYYGSDAQATGFLVDALLRAGPSGELAALLFRAMKASSRAKVYRGKHESGTSFRDLAYDRKGDALEQLAEFLDAACCAPDVWGWQRDEDAQHRNSWVLYCVIPPGQVSFHSPVRHAGPDFAGAWDRQLGVSESRVIAFCESVLEGQ